ncbi:MAG TPA: hypothetical protein VMD78_03390 [Candidatus Baltobacteraceae bacterium]|nr:hypothetical protein [Candidatus Baltobacteraceae bacterium]
MPVENKVDPFKPQAPAIPGVPAATEKPDRGAPEAPASEPTNFEQGGTQDAWSKMIGVIVGIGVVLVAGFMLLRPGHNSGAKSGVNLPTATQAPAAPTEPKSEPAEKLLTGPGPVATVAELSKPWSSREFLFRGTLTPDPVPAMVVRLPGGELWGFSLREPFGECELQYITDLKVLAANYGFQAQHPMVVNPCTRAVYDLAQYGGGAPNGGLVRGEIVQGSAVRPPMAIEMRTSGRDIVAVRGE